MTDVPPDLDAALADPALRAAWDALAPSHKREHLAAIAEAKKPETRARRVEKCVETLRAGRSRPMVPSTKPLAQKLGLKPQGRLRVLEAPAGFDVGPLPEGASVVDGPADAVLLFAVDAAAVERLAPVALAAAGADGLLWGAYRKGGAGLNRDRGWEPIKAAGWEGIAIVAIDDTWSALRFRPAERVGRG